MESRRFGRLTVSLAISTVVVLLCISTFGAFPASTSTSEWVPAVSSVGAEPAAQRSKRSGPISRRLDALITKSLRKMLTWEPVERPVPSLNLDEVVFVAGKHTAALSASFETTLEDILVLFYRWFDDTKTTNWAGQGLVTMESLKRQHTRYGSQMVKDYMKKQEEPEEDEEKKKAKLQPVQFYAGLGTCQRRVRDWLFDGNTFHRRGGEAFRIPDQLTENDVSFMRGLPFSVIRVAQGVFSEEPSASVKRLQRELKIRGVTTIEKLLSRTNFVDLFVLFDVFDETLSQIDVLREYHQNWQKYKSERYSPPQVPLGEWTEKRTMEEMLLDDNYAETDFPKCTTLKCVMQWTWRKTPERTIEVHKKNVNALKLLLIGSPGREQSYTPRDKRSNMHFLKKLGDFQDLEHTVDALKDWHTREKADAVLGLGDMLGLPGATTVRDERFQKKWHDIFIKDAGLDIPWLMTLGDADSVLSPSSQIRYHYSVQQKNWHMPNDYYTVNFKFGANLTLANGMFEETAFNATVIAINTWDLFVGNPVANNMASWTNKLWWLSEQLYQATQKNSSWIIVMGHHPMLSTGTEGEQARLQNIDDLSKSRRSRGLESFLINTLFMHYQVDAYVSGHDHLMEYNSITDVDRNVTVSFITSGATTRLFHKDVGRGWVGRLRGALYPVLCWGGRKVIYALNPGGCKPLHKDQQHPEQFFVQSHGGTYKVNIEERVTTATGFAAMKLTKDYLLMDFIDARTRKSAVHKVYRRTNREGRDIKFMDPFADGRLRYEELLLDREAFEAENAEAIEKEVAFARRCPVLAERLKFHIAEMNELASKYSDLVQQKEAYETMTDMMRDAMAQMGTNVQRKISEILSSMYVISADHLRLEQKYKEILQIKENLPEKEDPRYKDLFELEKQYAETRKLRRKTFDALQSDSGSVDVDDEENLRKYIMTMKLLRKQMDDLEREMKEYPDIDQKKAADEKKAKAEREKRARGPKNTIVIKPLDTSLLARIRRKELQLRRHHAVFEGLKRYPQSGLKKVRAEIDILKRQEESLRRELAHLHTLRQRSQRPMRPSDQWEKFQLKDELETKLRQIKAYMDGTDQMPAAKRYSQSVQDEIEAIEAQRATLEKQLTEVVDELADRKMTAVQIAFLTKSAELKRNELVLEQRKLLSPEELSLPQIQAALQAAADKQLSLQADVEALQDKVRLELNAIEDAWEQDMSAKGYNIHDLSEGVVVGPEVEQRTEKEAQAVVDSGAVTAAAETLNKLNNAEEKLAAVEEAMKDVNSVNGEDKTELETILGPLQKLPGNRKQLQEGVAELREKLEQEMGTLEHLDPTDEEGAKAKDQSEEKPIAANVDDADSTAESEKGNKVPTSNEEANSVQTDDRAEAAAAANNNVGDEATEATKTENTLSPGGTSRRLANVLELFKSKRDPSPFKKIEKIDVGPMDACMQVPMLEATVQRRLKPQSDEDTKEKCVHKLANHAYRQQLRYIHSGMFFSEGPQGLTPIMYDVPSVHVTRAWSEYFGYTHMSRFKSVMKDIRHGLQFVHQTYKTYSFVEAMLMELREAQRRREEELELPFDQDIDVKDSDIDMDALLAASEAPKNPEEEAKEKEEKKGEPEEPELGEDEPGADIPIEDIDTSYEDD
ncbi:acid phosphatase [Toxoplasma gondii TgCatPRC2]|uniref:Acid phosphatase n=2 Tax=Toxoplasma gondii TaxID=5811 RepID=A0A151H6Y8_TOXGO|nr:acid phosphatase [Toxoplasma gondii ARI]KYK65092.1 acid phosphatase [Toxoplasma gondii TgCatPRC2]